MQRPPKFTGKRRRWRVGKKKGDLKFTLKISQEYHTLDLQRPPESGGTDRSPGVQVF